MLSNISRLILCVTAAALAGCNAVGPSAIRSGRAAYNEAITATNNQQVFSLIVKSRFREAAGLLTVVSVNASFKVTGQVNAQFGIGPDQNFSGNLVPLSAGAAYEESPTISYTPVQGEDVLRQIFGPLPLDLTLLMIQASDDAGWMMTMFLKSINEIRNPAFLSEAEPKADPRFLQITELVTELRQAERLSLARNSEGAFVFSLPRNDRAFGEKIRRLFRLLSLPDPMDSDRPHEIPVVLGVGRTERFEVRVETRSLGDLIKIAGAAMEVPPEQVDAGLAARFPKLGSVGSLIRINGAPEAPKGALVAFKHHGIWYSIDQTDQKSKEYFRQLEALMSARIADSVKGGNASPVLTLPVAR
jgi:hypothetical protein